MLTHSDYDEIRDLLIGRKATKVDSETLTLDNGVTLQFEGNEGCGGCSGGHYEITELNGVDNIITAVEFDNNDDETFKIFVFADNQKINFLTVEGDVGSGWYSVGYYITVTGIDKA